MFELILLIMLLLSLYIAGILFVQIFKRLDTKSARQIVNKFLKECFCDEVGERQEVYDVFIGIDNGIPNYDKIDKVFSLLEKLYDTYHSSKVFWSTNIIQYCFEVGNVKKDIEEKELINYCEHLCNDIVLKYMRNNNPYIEDIVNLVAIRIREDKLYIMIAKNSQGTIENAQFINSRNSLYMQNKDKNNVISEKWGD